MTMKYALIDCYTDEPAGLGVPPYLGVYPRYIYGQLKEEDKENQIDYLTIDDLRLYKKYNSKQLIPKPYQKTNIATYNLTTNSQKIPRILQEADKIIIIIGVQTPGKYLSAAPGSIKEATGLLSGINSKKIITGPVLCGGTQQFGGKKIEAYDKKFFHEELQLTSEYKKIKKYSLIGAEILRQIPDLRIIEIETSHGCERIKGCSFCTEPLKHKLEFRPAEDVIDEINAFYHLGARHFRIGKQSCFYAYPDAILVLKEIRQRFPEIKTLHIDNVNPVNVVKDEKKDYEITKAIVEYCTPGNVAAFGAESFDPEVIKANNLNSNPETTMKAIEILNKFGSELGENGMPKFLPGINILFGLIGETKKTHEHNMNYLKQILEKNLLIRRINIREVIAYEGTELWKTKDKTIIKNKKHYWRWRNEIRQQIDLPMLQKLVPKGTTLKEVYTEIYDGNTTFGRQIGTYPLIVGIKQRVELKKFYDIKVIGHMLRSVVGEII